MSQRKSKRRWGRWVALALVCLLLAVGWWWLFGFGSTPVVIGPDTTFITGPLKPDGTPDYMAWLDEHYSKGVTPENNAVVLLVRAFGPETLPPGNARSRILRQLEVSSLPASDSHLVSLAGYVQAVSALAATRPDQFLPVGKYRARDHLAAACRAPWSAQDDPLLVAWLADMQRPLALVTEASQRSQYYVPLVPADGSGMCCRILPPISLPEAAGADYLCFPAHCFGAAKALTARAMFKAGTGYLDDAWGDLLTVHRLSCLFMQDGTWEGRGFALAWSNQACAGTCALATAGSLTAEQARRILADVLALPGIPDGTDVYEYAHRLALLSAAVVFSRRDLDNKELGGPPATAVGVDWNHVLRSVNRYCDQQVAVFQEPTFAGRKSAAEKVDAEARRRRRKFARWGWFKKPIRVLTGKLRLRGSAEVADYLIFQLSMSVSLANVYQTRASANRQLSIATLALSAYKGERGQHPDRLTDLVPGYLRAVPEDTFIGKPLAYRRTGEGYLLYSVGPNMKDDGGEKDSETGKDDLAVRVPAGSDPPQATQQPATRPEPPATPIAP